MKRKQKDSVEISEKRVNERRTSSRKDPIKYIYIDINIYVLYASVYYLYTIRLI